ncbi:SGNH/GDSL hydrolase family protein [Dyadobacter sandarakinus]|uniref:SGNH/GDSL hydrolase family protein n=1 Tax=Dyadobacter sandarakinus TaxID=2747268 RepID=A0ABX7I0H3_9BACT|nr:SGNH/GDSL hydrolase family protein [Dyadobacter sandarakinus]QRQ99520.1 SGNH/GDSL hydrolase family protein [Dyadobacter sandarakinus]
MPHRFRKFIPLLLLLLTALAPAPRKVTWVAIGDSITYLNDHQDETGNRVTEGYLTRITRQHPNVQYINQGHNGWTSVNIATRIDSIGLVQADVYTVFLGTNDWWQGKTLGTIRDFEENTGTGTVHGSFRIILDKLKTLNKKAQVILITPMQRGDFVYINNFRNNAFGSYKPKNGRTLEEFVNAVVEIGRHEKLGIVDLYHDSGITQDNMVNFKRLRQPGTGSYENYRYPGYIDVPFDPEKDEYPYPADAVNMTYDGLHPSDKGYEVIARMLAEKWKGL